MLILFLAIFTIYIFSYFPFELSEEDELEAISLGLLFYSFYFYDYFINWIFFTNSNVKSFFTNYPIGSFKHWFLKINRKNSIYLYKILLSPKALTPSSLRSSLSSTNKLSPSMLLLLKSSMQSPKPIWLSQIPTSSIFQKQTIYCVMYYFFWAN
jgi:hypothetical protein